MKKILVVLFLLSVCLFPQENKGRISLTFNDEKIDLAINTITLRKENHILISVRAEQNDSISQKMVAIELGFKKLTSDEKEGLDGEGIRMQIDTRDKSKEEGKSFIFRYPPLGEEDASYGVYNKGERMTWSVNSISMKLNIKEVNFSNGLLKIIGEFSGIFKSALDGKTRKEVAEIKDGVFEIII